MRAVFERYLTPTEESHLLRTAKAAAGSDTQRQLLARRDHAWMLLLRQTGIRVGTLAGLTCADAREALQTGYLNRRNAISKRGNGGKTYLTKKARGALLTLIRVRRAQGHAEQAAALLLCSRAGVGLSIRSIQHRMATWVRAANLPTHASPHWWRHTLAKRLMDNSTARDPRGVVQVVLGHQSIQSTSIYTMPDREDIAHAMNEVG